MAALKGILQTSVLVLISLLFFLSGCRPDLWGMPKGEDSRRETLLSIPSQVNLDRSDSLATLDAKGSGSAYCLARLLEKEDADKSRTLYLHEIEKGDPLWKSESLYRMVLLADTAGNHDELLVWGWKARSEFPGDFRILPFMIRSSFLVARYRDIPELIKAMPEPDAESLLYAAAAQALMESKNPDPLFEKAIFGIPLNAGYRNFYSVLVREGLLGRLSPVVAGYLQGRIFMLDRQYGRALPLLEAALADTRLAETAPLIFDDYRLCRSGLSGKAAGADALATRASALKNPASRRMAALGAVRLYRLEDLYLPAEAPALLAWQLSDPGPGRDEALWYYLRVLLELDLARFVSAPALSELSDPAYFDDLFEFATVRIVQERRWELLPELWQRVSARGSVAARSHVAWVTLLAVHYRFLPKEAVPVEALRDWLAGHDRWGSRGMLSLFIADSARSLRKPVEKWFRTRGERPLEPQKNQNMEQFFSALIRYGLTDIALEEMLLRHRETPSGTIRLCARFLLEAGDYYGAIRVLSRIFFEEWYEPVKEDILLMYPLAFRQEIEAAATEFDVDPALVFAVSRSESAFKADIVSHAGATGLMQLMPATAEERAVFLKLEGYRLTDPVVNIRMGTSHIRWLFERDWTTSPMDILIAYNAGGGNLRKWKRRYEGLPPLLLAEALPPKETRDYIRKNLLALVIYDHLYYHKDPDRVIRNFFGL